MADYSDIEEHIILENETFTLYDDGEIVFSNPNPNQGGTIGMTLTPDDIRRWRQFAA